MKGKKLSQQEYVIKLEKDKNERRKLHKAFCAHLAEGYSKESFSLTTRFTLERLHKSYPQDFPQEDIELALCDGRDMWETLGKRQASGDCMGNSRTWFYNMAHRYKWSDRIDVSNEHKGTVAVNIVSYASSKPSTIASE